RVESKPAEPKESGAKKREGNVVRQDGLTRIVLARPHHDGRDERRDRGIDVNDGAARVVERAESAKEPAAPDPVRDGRVDREAPQRDEDEIGLETHALDDRA